MAGVQRLRCARCGAARNPGGLITVCDCGGPYQAEYDLESLRGRLTLEQLGKRPGTLWRYRELLPDLEPVELGEGWTPTLAVPRLAASVGISGLWIKDESQNPTGSFKARGSAVAVSAARAAGATALAIASAGNAAAAMSAYAARAGLEAHCFAPETTPEFILEEIRAYGGKLYKVPGPLDEAGNRVRREAAKNGWFDLSTFKEPYRLEGKKTMGFELLEQLDGKLPDWILYPTGGGMGVMGLWKAFREMEEIGWKTDRVRPRMVAVQPSGCAPLATAFLSGAERAKPWGMPDTVAVGLRVPVCGISDLLLAILRDSGGEAVIVDDDALRKGAREIAEKEGICASPEGGATLAALRHLRRQGRVKETDRVVLFNTGWGGKYS